MIVAHKLIALPSASIAVTRMLAAFRVYEGFLYLYQIVQICSSVFSQAAGPFSDVLWLSRTQFGGFALGLQAWLLGSKFRVRIRFQETTHRTAERTHWNALFRWNWNITKPAGLTRCSLNPIADTTIVPVRPVEDEPLHHLAVALGTPNGLRTHAQTSGKGTGRSCHTLNKLFYCLYRH